MNLSNIQTNILDPGIDSIIAQELGTESCLEVYTWIEKNTPQLRSWVLFSMTGTNTNSPMKNSSVIENSVNGYEKTLLNAYKKADELFPLSSEKSKKEIVRERIFEEIGDYDIYEMVADLSKRICLLERLLLRLAKAEKDEAKLPETIINLYGEMIDTYAAGVENRMIKDRTDLENNWSVFTKLQQRTAKIAEIVEEEMYR